MGYTIAGIGELLWDMLPGGKQPGGAPGNLVCHAGALGCEAVLVSRVGDDSAGHELLTCLDRRGVNRDYITMDPGHPTGMSTVDVDEWGVPAFVVHENSAWDFIEYTPRLTRLARRVDAVCFGTLPQRSRVSRETLASFLGETRPSTLRLFDANLRHPYYTRPVVETSLKMANVLKLNDDELSVMSDYFSLGGDTPSRLRRLSRRFELRAVALTSGVDGSVLVAEGQVVAHPGYAAQVVDTVGAGDAFAAAFAVGLLDGDGLERIAERANRLASFVCTKAGATPEIPPDLLAGPPG